MPKRSLALDYPKLLAEVKERIRRAQIKASLSANAEMLLLYWDIGRIIVSRQKLEGWGAKVVLRLAADLRNDLPEVKGFSLTNLKRMQQFYTEYQSFTIGPPPVGQLDEPTVNDNIRQLVPLLPWAHNAVLLSVKDRSIREWYMKQTLEEGWSKDFLQAQIKRNAHLAQGKAVTNFAIRLPPAQSALAQETIKNPYLFDFITMATPFHERELETGLLAHIEKFLLELGSGFAFVGRQYHLAVNEQDFYLDLLFYNIKLHCYVVIDLKVGAFKPEYAGKMNFYCTAVDELLRSKVDNPTIGLILCQHHDKVIAEWSLHNVATPIGVSEYELTRVLPKKLKSSLPSIEEIEESLSFVATPSCASTSRLV